MASVMRCLNKYEYWSGKKISLHKSSLLFSPNASHEIRRSIHSVSGMQQMKGNERYLGNPLFFSRKKAVDFAFIKKRLEDRVESWQAKLLSRASRTTLIQAVAMSIPTYSMPSFLLPKQLCSEIDAIVRRFWWTGSGATKRFLALKSWDALCKPKECGGLGFRRFYYFNLALLSKLGWKVVAGEDVFWVKALQAKYYRTEKFRDTPIRSDDSFVWKGILQTRSLLAKGCFEIVGSGESIYIWARPWVPGIPMGIPRAFFNRSHPNPIRHPNHILQKSNSFSYRVCVFRI